MVTRDKFEKAVVRLWKQKKEDQITYNSMWWKLSGMMELLPPFDKMFLDGWFLQSMIEYLEEMDKT